MNRISDVLGSDYSVWGIDSGLLKTFTTINFDF